MAEQNVPAPQTRHGCMHVLLLASKQRPVAYVYVYVCGVPVFVCCEI